MPRLVDDYNADSVDVHLGLDGVRESPQVYISALDSDGILHLAKEGLDNAADEAEQRAVQNKTVGIIIDKDAFWILDYGRGIPVERHKTTKISTLTTIMTTLSAGAKMRTGDKSASYKKTAGVHGMGISITNALSTKFEVWTYRNNWHYQQFAKGKPPKNMAEPVKSASPQLPYLDRKAQPRQGTVIKFTPDYSLFDAGAKLPENKLRELLRLQACLHPKLKFIFYSARDKRWREYSEPNGLSALAARQLKELGAEVVGKPFEYHDELVNVVLQWSSAVDEAVLSFVNGSPTRDGGSHVQFMGQAINDALAPHKGKRSKYRSEDLRAGLVGVINIGVDRPRFTNQTKEKLQMPELKDIRDKLQPALAKFFASNKATVREIIRRANENFKANQEFKLSKQAAADMRTQKGGKVLLPPKLASALSNKPEEIELFLVEGDSAGGTAKEARDRQYQAVLPLFGKILNVQKAAPSKIIANEVIKQILQAVGYDQTLKDPFSRLRVGKIFFMADADPDGEHINLLLTGLFYKILRPLVEAGKVYVAACDSLFTTQVQGKHYYGESIAAVQKQLPKNAPAKLNFSRIKGLGELNAPQLREIAFDPKTRKVKQLQAVTGKRLQQFLSVIGSDTEFRKELLGVN